ncbi:SHOCT domain-containing protein [Halococcoides cellulosivorans]|uniref:SHOCT domain-containing protein n=1 Tax=Halococcoides cellulosivorans TaxID=1679096 RepID=A0A2R4X1C9_9EURY|nr:SHOCT domain-containing protein [Halococcoides cellulosivorans]AWB27604.1 hypothetical protein HARCEL1_07715 [Halococcoides cellulosivorans]
MTQRTTHLERTARRLVIVAVPLVVATGTAMAHSGGSGGMMGGWGGMGGLGLLGGGMLLWPLVLVGIVLLAVYAGNRGGRTDGTDRARSELRDRYARGELSDDEFESRRRTLDQ